MISEVACLSNETTVNLREGVFEQPRIQILGALLAFFENEVIKLNSIGRSPFVKWFIVDLFNFRD